MERACERCGIAMPDDGSAVPLCPGCLIGLGLDTPEYHDTPRGRRRPVTRRSPIRAAGGARTGLGAA